MANILYQKLERQYSDDGGNTWISMNVYKVGDILENPSDCTNSGTSTDTQCKQQIQYQYSEYTLIPSVTEVSFDTISVSVTVTRDFTATTTYSNCSTSTENGTESTIVFPYSYNPIGINYTSSNRTVTATTQYGTFTYTQLAFGNAPSTDEGGDSSGSTSGETDTIYRWVVSDSINDYYCDYNAYTKYAMEYEEYSDDNGSTWIRTGNKRQSSTILETNSEDCGYTSGGDSSGSTSGGTDNPNTSGSTSGSTNDETLSFAWSGTSSSKKFKINNTTYTATTNPYSTTLTELGVDTFTSTYQMFNGETKITAITSIPDTSNVTNMDYMFSNCYSLTSLDVTKRFNTSNVTTMNGMFENCSNLTSLDLSNFDTSNVTSMYYMFNGCNNLTLIKVTNCSDSTISKLQEALTSAGYSSTVANGIITVNH